MTINFLIKDKINFLGKNKARINWNQSLDLAFKNKNAMLYLKKKFHLILLLRKFNNEINFKNLILLKAFLTKCGKIKPRRKTQISSINQRKIAKAIKKARVYKLIPFTCSVNI